MPPPLTRNVAADCTRHVVLGTRSGKVSRAAGGAEAGGDAGTGVGGSTVGDSAGPPQAASSSAGTTAGTSAPSWRRVMALDSEPTTQNPEQMKETDIAGL